MIATRDFVQNPKLTWKSAWPHGMSVATHCAIGCDVTSKSLYS
jgi:hypothetical protein